MPRPGDIIHVWEPKGILNGQTSENDHSGGTVLPSEDLQVIGPAPNGDKLEVKRLTDGLRLLVHFNHYDPYTAYNLRTGNKHPTKDCELRFTLDKVRNLTLNP